MDRRAVLSEATRIVIKIGSSSIMGRGSAVSRGFMDSVASQVRRLRDEGREVMVVSSGAIAIGLKAMGVVPKPHEMPIRQAAASVGQSILMKEWGDSFQKEGILVGQVLLTMDDYSERKQAVSLNSTIESLLKCGVVPIFNENDAVSDFEIKFGDNDTLSAIVASRADADLLVILSDVSGLYDADPSKNPDAELISVVENVDSVRHMAGDSVSGVGTGGMVTKLDAADICSDAGCMMIIASSSEPDAAYRAASGENLGTLFLADAGITKKRRWIKTAHPVGRIEIDDGASKAVLNRRSLLPVGIKGIEGRFDAGDVVEIVCGGEVIAKGMPSYDSTELEKIMGIHSSKIKEILGHPGYSDAVLSENIALLRAGGAFPNLFLSQASNRESDVFAKNASRIR